MALKDFLRQIFVVAQDMGFKIETNRNGQTQIDFGHKKLHEGHLRAMYPQALLPGTNISKLIDRVAPGRPCSHRPMKNILARLALTE